MTNDNDKQLPLFEVGVPQTINAAGVPISERPYASRYQSELFDMLKRATKIENVVRLWELARKRSDLALLERGGLRIAVLRAAIRALKKEKGKGSGPSAIVAVRAMISSGELPQAIGWAQSTDSEQTALLSALSKEAQNNE